MMGRQGRPGVPAVPAERDAFKAGGSTRGRKDWHSWRENPHSPGSLLWERWSEGWNEVDQVLAEIDAATG